MERGICPIAAMALCIAKVRGMERIKGRGMVPRRERMEANGKVASWRKQLRRRGWTPLCSYSLRR